MARISSSPSPAQERSASPNAAPNAAVDEPNETHLHGWRLVAARTLVGATMAVVAVVFAQALPSSINRLATPCNDPVNQCLIRPEQVAPLADFGITPASLAIAATLISCLIVLAVDGAAALLIWRRSDDWMALLVALVFSLMPLHFTPVLEVLTSIPGDLPLVVAALGEISSVSLILLIALSPSGRFVPRWLWLPFLLLVLFFSPLGDLPIPGPAVPDVLSFVFLFALLLCFVVSLIYRYRRVSTAIQRQQIKWLIYAFILFIVLNQLFWQTYLQVPAFQAKDSLYGLLAYPEDFLALSILLVALGVSVLRYRLYDIDLIIKRTLVYGSLTAILASVYVVGVIGSQTVVGGLTHLSGQQQSPVITVVTTLVIVILFRPVRRHIQAFIDRRFYRRKYDARKTLAAFSTRLRQEVSLTDLRADLLAVVEQTMQPASVSLWLTRPPWETPVADKLTTRPATEEGLST